MNEYRHEFVQGLIQAPNDYFTTAVADLKSKAITTAEAFETLSDLLIADDRVDPAAYDKFLSIQAEMDILLHRFSDTAEEIEKQVQAEVKARIQGTAKSEKLSVVGTPDPHSSDFLGDDELAEDEEKDLDEDGEGKVDRGLCLTSIDTVIDTALPILDYIDQDFDDINDSTTVDAFTALARESRKGED